jgi:predicted Zn-dependent protease with MMP-like domain
MVGEVLAALPEQFRARLSNVAVVVDEWPPDDADDAGGGPDGDEPELLGLYQGVPYGDRATDYHLALPDRITIYRRPILAQSRTEAEAREEVRLTVLHEIGHYFGLGDDELP